MERKGKHVSIRVIFLDDQVHAFQVHVKAYGSQLWEAVIRHLNLLEADYFDLEFEDLHGLECWLDKEKQILKQLPNPDTPLRFLVKFYTPDPALLEDELTRYLFALQVKRDLAQGLLTCSDNTMALLASYVAQAEVGDFPIEEYADHTYLRANNLRYVPRQTEELEKKIMEYHKQHVGETPAEADVNLLDTARKVELYGIRMNPAKDHENVSLNLAVSHSGIHVFQGMTKINTFSWAKVRKLSFKRKRFLIKLHPENCGYYKDLVEFFFDTRDDCKGFWKKCIEHHGFYRCQKVRKIPRHKTRVVSKGSSFRYSGRTQKQLNEYIRESFPSKRPQFERTVSGRISNRSTSVTPKIPAKVSLHNSADLHNDTASSGSHVLDQTQSTLHYGNDETMEIHSESSVSGSRSLNSPKLERIQSQEEDVPRPEVGEFVHEEVDDKEDAMVTMETQDQVPPARFSPGRSPRLPHLLSREDRKVSAPVIGSKEEALEESERHLSRTDEVENIPETMEERRAERLSFHLVSNEGLGMSRSHSSEVTSPGYDSPSPAVNDSVNISEMNLPPPPYPALSPGSTDESPPPYPQIVSPGSTDSYPPPPPPPLSNDISLTLSNGSTPRRDPKSSASALNSNISTLSDTKTEGSEDDNKRRNKRYPVDRAYYIAKELLMTERTYKKDLEVITVWFKNCVSGEEVIADYLLEMFKYVEPIYKFHVGFLKEVEQRLAMWEGKSNAHLNGDYQRIGDIMVNSFLTVLEAYMNYLEKQDDILMELDKAVKTDKEFEFLYKDFEGQKVCYLPLNTFLLKPGQRLLHYKLLLERITKHYSTSHPDYAECSATLMKLSELTNTFKSQRKCMENLQKLMELQRDLVGLDSLVHPDREFIREGCLQKFSRKGYQQRMFFLFSDMLVYTSRTAMPLLQFKVHGQVPLRGMIIEESDHAKMAVANSFAIYGGNKCILVAASSQEEKDKWIEDLNEAVMKAKNRNDDKLKFASLKSSTSSTENVEAVDGNNPDQGPPSPEKQIQHRANTTMHVCWHRNTSVSKRDFEKAVKNQLSGYLLRKFKNSNGWQKLWVVFTNFCLYFYKTYQDDYPLASLPLLGYAVSQPEDSNPQSDDDYPLASLPLLGYAVSQPEDGDGIHKDHVFKLQFKNHVYFFRAESEYTFERWMEVINSATSSARRIRLFSRMDSTQP